MKKIVSIIAIFLVLFLLTCSISIYAATQEELNSIQITTDKETVHPGETVTLNVDFGKDLGAYTINVAYADDVFDYVRSEGGNANDTGEKVILTYHDEAGGTNPRTNAVETASVRHILSLFGAADSFVSLDMSGILTSFDSARCIFRFNRI